ncbi:MAG: DM13 domain-containing protein [Chitinophagaceae bacterium]
MKSFLLMVLVSAVLLVSCVKNNTPGVSLDNTVDTSVAMPKHDGDFINGPYGSVSGMAIVYNQNGSLVLALQNVMISNGPQLHVYLSKEVQPVNFIDLGSLQSTKGNQLYNIEGQPDFSQYKYALIHCKKYNHLFGSAKLQ